MGWLPAVQSCDDCGMVDGEYDGILDEVQDHSLDDRV